MSTRQERMKPITDVAVIGRDRIHGKPRQIIVKLPIQIELTVHEGLTARHEVVSIDYRWKIFFNGREVERSKKLCPNEAKAIRAAHKEARNWAKRTRARGRI